MSDEATNQVVMKPWEIRERMQQARGILLVEGIILLLCGLFAIVISPFLASTALILIMGWLAIVCGVLLFVRCFVGSAESQVMNVVNAFLITGLGVLFIIWPFASLEVVTLFLAGWCLVVGVMDVFGFPARSNVNPGVQFISGICGIVLAILLLIWWPSDALWAPGMLFGLQLLFMGFAILAARNAVGGNKGGVASPPAMPAS